MLMCCGSGHVFFELQGTNGHYVVDYDMAHDKRRLVELEGAGKRDLVDYKGIHIPRGSTNVLHVEYNNYSHVSREIEKGIDYKTGIYQLDMLTGNLTWFVQSTDDGDDENYYFRAAMDGTCHSKAQ